MLRPFLLIAAVVTTGECCRAEAADLAGAGDAVALANTLKPSRIVLGKGIAAAKGLKIYPYLETLIGQQGMGAQFDPVPDLTQRILMGGVARYGIGKDLKLTLDMAVGRTYLPLERDGQAYLADSASGDRDNVWRVAVGTGYRLGASLDFMAQLVRSNMMPSQFLHMGVIPTDKEYQDTSVDFSLRFRFQ